MKIVIQRVLEANVVVEQEIVGQIDQGLMILVGIEQGDTFEDVQLAARKLSAMRIFDDHDGVMNLSIQDVKGSILSISQFTLAADIRKGNRPSYSKAMPAQEADDLYNQLNDCLRKDGIQVETGRFQAHMNVSLNNDGPVSIIMIIKDGKIHSV